MKVHCCIQRKMNSININDDVKFLHIAYLTLTPLLLCFLFVLFVEFSFHPQKDDGKGCLPKQMDAASGAAASCAPICSTRPGKSIAGRQPLALAQPLGAGEHFPGRVGEMRVKTTARHSVTEKRNKSYNIFIYIFIELFTYLSAIII